MSQPALVSIPQPTRTLPHNLEAEAAVLGASLLGAGAFDEIRALVEPGDFYHPANEAIFEAMAAIDSDGGKINHIAVAEQMRRSSTYRKLSQVGGDAYFGELMSNVITVENIAFYGRLVAAKARARRIILAAQEIAAAGYHEGVDADEYAAEAERHLLALTASSGHAKVARAADVADEVLNDLLRLADRGSAITGVSSGLASLDEQTCGWQAGELIVLAAQPSIGKTALTLQMLCDAAESGIPSLFISLEMRDRPLIRRLLVAKSGVNGTTFRRGSLTGEEWRKVYRARVGLENVLLDVVTGATRMGQIRAVARRWRAATRKDKADRQAILALDYLTLIDLQRERGESKSDAVGRVALELKRLAQELEVPAIVLAQLSRDIDKRGKGKPARPRLSDLRDSGEIEQHADAVVFLYSEQGRHVEQREIEAIVEKQRDGNTGSAKLVFDRPLIRFRDANAQMALPT